MDKEKIISWIKEWNKLYKKYEYLYRGTAGEFGLSDSMLCILYTIRMENDACSQSKICDLMMQSKQTVNSAVKKMAETGLVELAGTEENKKSKLVTLTADGEALAEKTADKVIQAEVNAASALSEEELESFLGLFDKFTGLLQVELEALRNK